MADQKVVVGGVSMYDEQWKIVDDFVQELVATEGGNPDQLRAKAFRRIVMEWHQYRTTQEATQPLPAAA